MSLLNVQSLTHGFGDRTLWQNVDVRLSPREHVALTGRNGVGKSTLLQILAGHLPHDSGLVQWLPGSRVGYLTQHADLRKGLSMRAFLHQAFAEVYDKEQLFEQAAANLATAQADELDSLLARYARLQEELEHMGIYELDARADAVASGLGLLSLGLDRDVSELSGGQRTKLLLAKLLLEQPDVLLLDEPTNYLDAEHVDWLGGFLRDYSSAFIVVSHDVSFIRRIANVVWQIENGGLLRYSGDYDAFLRYAQERQAGYTAAYKRQQEEIDRLETFVQKNIARASTTKRAQSRRKQLEKMDRLTAPTVAGKPSFSFAEARPPARIALRATGLRIGYRHALLPPLDIEIERGRKVAVTGCNGIGKSTLLRTLLGEVAPVAGRAEFGDGIVPGYFAQEQAVGDSTPLDVVWSAFPELAQKEVRSALARVGIKADHLMRPLRSLSGGEQAKVRLCLITLRPVNTLVLDEPTNHLDKDAKAALQAALAQFHGTVLLVSHEPDFYEPFVTDVLDVEGLAARGKPSRLRAIGSS